MTQLRLALVIAYVTAAIGGRALAQVQPDGGQQPASAVDQWIAAHPRVMKVWANMFFTRQELTPSARRCIDECPMTQEKGQVEGNALLTCGNVGKAELRGHVEPWPSDGWAQSHPSVMCGYAMQFKKPTGEVDWKYYTARWRTCIDGFGRSLTSSHLIECQQREMFERQRHRAERLAASRQGIREHQSEAIKKWLGALLAYRVALAEDKRDAAKEEIAKEKKYSRVGGVVNKAAIYESQQQIRAADEIIEAQQQAARTNQVKVLARNDPKVDRVQECIDSHYDPQLSSGVTQQDIDDVVAAATSFKVEGQDCLWILLLLRATED